MSLGSSSSVSWSCQASPQQEEHLAAPFHILLGRGRGAYQSEGNRRLRQIIGWFLPEYMAATTSKKKLGITNKIVVFVQEQGGRFGAEDLAGNFNEAPDRQARVKVAQLVRCFKRRAVEESSMAQGDFQSFASSASGIMDDHLEWSDQVLDEVAAACLDAPQELPSTAVLDPLLCEPTAAESQSGGQEQTRTTLETLLQESDRVLNLLATACLDQPQQCPDTKAPLLDGAFTTNAK